MWRREHKLLIHSLTCTSKLRKCLCSYASLYSGGILFLINRVPELLVFRCGLRLLTSCSSFKGKVTFYFSPAVLEVSKAAAHQWIEERKADVKVGMRRTRGQLKGWTERITEARSRGGSSADAASPSSSNPPLTRPLLSPTNQVAASSGPGWLPWRL